ncbi:MAG: hypothetical protein KVP17_000535 [Porospora cf. gigantea B]|uniref:uncharacterized protein n=2 Tax=Porospora cf. gigantea B TaxID=2853592 RepID=UPI00357192D7|nr:MAG: hypothetical protein KVP17_000535 [Porospora cf. gigantea B]
MARNAEKALGTLNRWQTLKKAVTIGGAGGRRPRFSESVTNSSEAEYWRKQVECQIIVKVSEIQNAGLGEMRIRELNDQINRHIREKHRWENRILELGGPDYRAANASGFDQAGVELAGAGGYKYYGAAKNLPGVRDLFEAEKKPLPQRKTRAQLSRNITPDYFGWRDAEDQELLAAEAALEAANFERRQREWQLKVDSYDS